MADIIELNEKQTWDEHITNVNNPHNTRQLTYSQDERTIIYSPKQYRTIQGLGVLYNDGLKKGSLIGSNHDWAGLLTYNYWTDSSGGSVHQLRFDNNGIAHRIENYNDTSGETWNNWTTLAKKEDFINLKTEIKNEIKALTWGAEGRISLKNNDDLNNYLTVGMYSASSNALAATIINSPCKDAFTMTVWPSTGHSLSINPASHTYIMQEILAYNNTGRYYRYIWTSANGNIMYGEWRKLAYADEVPTMEKGTSDLTAGSSPLENNKIYLVYE